MGQVAGAMIGGQVAALIGAAWGQAAKVTSRFIAGSGNPELLLALMDV